jgi:hypothetical protein
MQHPSTSPESKGPDVLAPGTRFHVATAGQNKTEAAHDADQAAPREIPAVLILAVMFRSQDMLGIAEYWY